MSRQDTRDDTAARVRALLATMIAETKLQAADEQQAIADLHRPPPFTKDYEKRLAWQREEDIAKGQRRGQQIAAKKAADEFLRLARKAQRS